MVNDIDLRVEMLDPDSPGLRVRYLRLMRGWSVSDLSSRSNVSQAALWRFENRRTSLRLNPLLRVLEALKVDANWVVSGTGEPPIAEVKKMTSAP